MNPQDGTAHISAYGHHLSIRGVAAGEDHEPPVAYEALIDPDTLQPWLHAIADPPTTPGQTWTVPCTGTVGPDTLTSVQLSGTPGRWSISGDPGTGPQHLLAAGFADDFADAIIKVTAETSATPA